MHYFLFDFKELKLFEFVKEYTTKTSQSSALTKTDKTVVCQMVIM